MSPRPRSHEQRRREAAERLTGALAGLICEQGYQRTTAVEIGLRAGYSRGAVHDRYGTKDEVLLALHRDYERALLGGDDVPAPERFSDFVTRLAGFAQQHPVRLKAILIVTFESVGVGEVLRPTVRAWLQRLEHEVIRLMEVDQQQGDIRPDVDLAAWVPGAIEMMLGVAFRWSIGGPGANAPELIESLRMRLRTDVVAEAAPDAG